MKMKILAACAAFVALGISTQARADAEGLFGGRPNQDGSVDVRASTIEQTDPIRGESVRNRARPDYDPVPIEYESFQFFPSVALGSYYNSNIYAVSSGETDDFIFKTDPAITITSDWGRHAIAFTGLVDVNTYLNHRSEDNTGGLAQFEGRYDIANQTWLAGNMSYQRDTEPRSSTNTLGSAAEPTQFNLVQGNAEFYRGVGILKLKADYDLAYYDYNTVKLVGGGLASQNGRNRVQNGVVGRASYDITENFQPFIRAGYSMRDYTSNSQRSSNGYQVDVGAKVDFGGITTGEAYVGYLDRNYYNFSGGNVGVADFGGNLLWNVTTLTSVQAEGKRSIEETTLGGISSPAASSSYLATGGSLTVTHELMRNMLIEGNFGYTNDKFELSSRNDDIYDASAGTRYFMNRNLYADLLYNFETRSSNTPGSGYNQHIVFLRCGLQY